MKEVPSEYEIRMEARKRLWNKLCPGVDTLIEEYAQKNHAEHNTSIQDHDPAARVISWSFDSGIDYSVSMYIDSGPETKNHLKLFAAAWRDDEDELKRYSIDAPNQTLETPIKPELFSEALRVAKEELDKRSGALTYPSHPMKNEILTTPLLPRPPGFSDT